MYGTAQYVCTDTRCNFNTSRDLQHSFPIKVWRGNVKPLALGLSQARCSIPCHRAPKQISARIRRRVTHVSGKPPQPKSTSRVTSSIPRYLQYAHLHKRHIPSQASVIAE